MNNTEPLKNLRDLHLPDPIGIWPLAYGWYIVIAIVSIILIALGCYAYRKHKAAKGRKIALKDLEKIKQDYFQKGNKQNTVYSLNVLIKRTCFFYYPREKVAGLHSNDWLKFLGGESWCQQLVDFSYKNMTDEDEPAELFEPIQQWIKKCGKEL